MTIEMGVGVNGRPISGHQPSMGQPSIVTLVNLSGPWNTDAISPHW